VTAPQLLVIDSSLSRCLPAITSAGKDRYLNSKSLGVIFSMEAANVSCCGAPSLPYNIHEMNPLTQRHHHHHHGANVSAEVCD